MAKSNHKEFSKLLLIQESVLIWIHTIAHISLAFYCITLGYTGTLPWLAASASLPWAAYGVSQVYYYKKSLVENSKGGIKYETVLKELDSAYSGLSLQSMVIEEKDNVEIVKKEYKPDLNYGI